MTYDEQRSILSEKLDNVTSRLILACREHDRESITQSKNEVKRILMDYETLIDDITSD